MIVHSSHEMIVPSSLLALRNVTVEMMKLELTKLTSAFIDDNPGPILSTGEVIILSKPNEKLIPSSVVISQPIEPSSFIHIKTALSSQTSVPLDSCCNRPSSK